LLGIAEWGPVAVFRAERKENDMSGKDEQLKQAQEEVVRELGNQARHEPGSKEEDESKERRAQAEAKARRAQESKT
jgi:hypothetical protein